MLVAVQVDRANRAAIMKILQSGNREYLFFASGTLSQIAGVLGNSCDKCRGKIDASSGDGDDFFIIYTFNEKMETMDLLSELACTGLTKVQTAPSVKGFFSQRTIVCELCSKRPNRMVSPPTKKRSTENTVANRNSGSEGTSSASSTISEVQDQTFIRSSSENSGEFRAHSAGADSPSSDVKRARVASAPVGQNVTPPVGRSILGRPIKSEATEADSTFEKTPLSSTSSGRLVIKINRKRHSDQSEDAENESYLSETCQKCNRTMSVRKHTSSRSAMMQSLLGHTKTHSDNYPYHCNTCHHKSRFESAIKDHVRRHGEGATYTSICNDPLYKAEIHRLKDECFPTWTKYM